MKLKLLVISAVTVAALTLVVGRAVLAAQPSTLPGYGWGADKTGEGHSGPPSEAAPSTHPVWGNP
jgi:hypothetical protein